MSIAENFRWAPTRIVDRDALAEVPEGYVTLKEAAEMADTTEFVVAALWRGKKVRACWVQFPTRPVPYVHVGDIKRQVWGNDE